jgi:hypothetical protein
MRNRRNGNSIRRLPVRLDAELVHAARIAAISESRTVSEQIEFWARVGRTGLDNPDLPASFIAEAILAADEAMEKSVPFVPRTGHR